MNGEMNQMNGGEQKGPVWGIVIVVLIIIVGGIYVFWSRHNNSNLPGSYTSTTTDEMGTSTSPTSDSVGDLKAEAASLDPNTADQNLPALEKSL